MTGHVEPRTLPNPVGKVTNFDSKSQGLFLWVLPKNMGSPYCFFASPGVEPGGSILADGLFRGWSASLENDQLVTW